MSSCVFCTINESIFDDNHFWIIKDNYPVSSGHTLIIPKKHILSLFDLDQQDFIKDIDQSIISLIQNPAGKLEQNAARDKQIELMTEQPTGRDLETLRDIDRRITPDTDEQRFYDTTFQPDVSLQPNIPGVQLNPQTRSDLAFGTLDDALETQMMNRGIGTL